MLRAELFCFFTRAAPGHGPAVVALSRNRLMLADISLVQHHQGRQVQEQKKKKNHVSRA